MATFRKSLGETVDFFWDAIKERYENIADSTATVVVSPSGQTTIEVKDGAGRVIDSKIVPPEVVSYATGKVQVDYMPFVLVGLVLMVFLIRRG